MFCSPSASIRLLCNRGFRGPCVVRLALALFSVVEATAACSTVPQPPPLPPPVEPYVVGAPDVLNVLIVPEPRIERSVVVRPDGMISIDLIGPVPAVGRTPEEIAADVQNRIAPLKAGAQVTVWVTSPASRTVTLLGEVRSPSTIVLPGQTRLSQAIGLVGGPTLFASKGKVRIVRYENFMTVVHSVDFSAIENGDLAENMFLQGGDLVVVPPTVLARIGYAMAALLFPFQPLFPVAGLATGYAIGR